MIYFEVKSMVKCKVDGYNNDYYIANDIPKRIFKNIMTNEIGCKYNDFENGVFYPCKNCNKKVLNDSRNAG